MTAELREPVQWLRDGGVICHACEGVWGLACDPFNEDAVRRILEIKQRPQSKGLIVIASKAAYFEPELAALNGSRRTTVEESWPGRTTWILPTTRFPVWITGENASVAARVPGHQQARAIASLFDGPLVSTSANVATENPCETEDEAREKFGAMVDCVVHGAIKEHRGSSNIFDAITGKQLR